MEIRLCNQHESTREMITERDLKDKEPQERSFYKPLQLDILEDGDASITTAKLLDYIPIRELFSSIEYTKSKSRKGSEDLLVDIEDLKKRVSTLNGELAKIAIINKGGRV